MDELLNIIRQGDNDDHLMKSLPVLSPTAKKAAVLKLRTVLGNVLVESAKFSRVKCVQALALRSNDFNINFKQDEQTALMAAVNAASEQDAHAMTKALVDNGANIRMKLLNERDRASGFDFDSDFPLFSFDMHDDDDDSDVLPLHAALSRSDGGSPRVIQLLLDKVTVRAKKGYRLPHDIAVAKFSADILKTILDFEHENGMRLSAHRVHCLADEIFENLSFSDRGPVFRVLFDRYADVIIHEDRYHGSLLTEVVKEFTVVFPNAESDERTDNSIAKRFIARIRELPSQQRDSAVGNALAATISKHNNELFELLLECVTPGFAQQLNTDDPEVFGDKCEPQTYEHHPLFMAVNSANLSQFKKILKLGITGQGHFSMLAWTWCQNWGKCDAGKKYEDTGLSSFKSSGMLANVIVGFGDSDVVEAVQVYLTSQNVHPNISRDPPESHYGLEMGQELPPLVALALRVPQREPLSSEFSKSSVTPAITILRTLLEEGAHLHFKSVKDRFHTPDVVIVSALVGNLPILMFLVARIGFDPDTVLIDLKRYYTEKIHERCREPESRMRTRESVGASVQVLLALTSKMHTARNLCVEIEQLSRPHDFDKIKETGKAWREIQCGLDQVDSLQQLSRGLIFRHLMRYRRSEIFIEALIDHLPIPQVIKEYLQYV